jgi:hypothetical protein
LLDDLGVRQRLRITEAGHRAALSSVLGHLVNVEALCVPDTALDITDANDDTALLPQLAGDNAPDVAETCTTTRCPRRSRPRRRSAW